MKFFKGFMEEIEKEKARKDIGKADSAGAFKTPHAARKIGGAEVLRRGSASAFGGIEPAPRQDFPKSGYFESSPFSGYKDRLRALESENSARLKKPILSGDICGDCHDYSEGSTKTADFLKDRENLANAVVMSEILSKPLALRDFRDAPFLQ